VRYTALSLFPQPEARPTVSSYVPDAYILSV